MLTLLPFSNSPSVTRMTKSVTCPSRRFSTMFRFGRFRAECLKAHWFLSLADAREKLGDWRKYYTDERPHGAIGEKPPVMLLNHHGAASPPC